MRCVIFKFFASLMFLSIAYSVYAASPEYVTREYPWVMRSVKALGMGNAYYTKSDSKYAPFYNPAGLNRVEKGLVDILPIGASINSNGIDAYSDVRDAMNNSDNETALLENFAKKHIGKNQFAGFSFYPGYTRKDLTVGLFANAQVNALPSNPVLPEVGVRAIMDGGVVVGLASDALDRSLQYGIAMRYQYRFSANTTVTSADVAADDLDFNDRAERKGGVLADLGVIYNIPNFIDGTNPRAGLAVNNVGMDLGGDKGEDIPYSINVSFGISPSYSYLKTDLILDVIDITGHFKQDNDVGKRINMGAELSLDMYALRHFFLRAGLHQGYPTVGFSLDIYDILRFDYAYYTEEVGAYAGQLADKRHVLELVIGF